MKCIELAYKPPRRYVSRRQSLLFFHGKRHKMLTNISTRIICVACGTQSTVNWISNIVCRHICGVREFFLIAVGSTKVMAAFCVICPDCLREYSFDDKKQELECLYAKAKETDIASRIRDLTHLSVICTYDTAMNRLKTIRPEIEVRRIISIHARGWLG